MLVRNGDDEYLIVISSKNNRMRKSAHQATTNIANQIVQDSGNDPILLNPASTSCKTGRQDLPVETHKKPPLPGFHRRRLPERLFHTSQWLARFSENLIGWLKHRSPAANLVVSALDLLKPKRLGILVVTFVRTFNHGLG